MRQSSTVANLAFPVDVSQPTLFAVGVARRVAHATGRARRETCLTGHFAYAADGLDNRGQACCCSCPSAGRSVDEALLGAW